MHALQTPTRVPYVPTNSDDMVTGLLVSLRIPARGLGWSEKIESPNFVGSYSWIQVWMDASVHVGLHNCKKIPKTPEMLH